MVVGIRLQYLTLMALDNQYSKVEILTDVNLEKRRDINEDVSHKEIDLSR